MQIPRHWTNADGVVAPPEANPTVSTEDSLRRLITLVEALAERASELSEK